MSRSACLIFSTVLMLMIAGCGSGKPYGGTGSTADAKTKPPPAITLNTAAAEASFALLRGQAELPPLRLIQRFAPALRMRWAWAQRLRVAQPAVWLVPRPSQLCLVQQRPAASVACTRLENVLKKGMFISSVPSQVSRTARYRVIVGLAPDGVAAVRIHARYARPRTAPVVENVFALRDHGRAFPESIELVRAR